MREDIHKRVKETLNGLDGLKRSEAPPYLYAKIVSRLQGQTTYLPRAFAWQMMVLLAMVSLLNVFTLLRFDAEKRRAAGPRTEEAEALATAYSIALPQTYLDE